MEVDPQLVSFFFMMIFGFYLGKKFNAWRDSKATAPANKSD